MERSKNAAVQRGRGQDAPARRQLRPGGRWPRILVVDDNRDMCMVVAFVLEGLTVGQSLSWESDPRIAMESVRENPLDLLVTDLTMPHVDGAALIEAVRRRDAAHDRETRVLAITGERGWPERKKAFAAGADDVISKPFEPSVFVGVVRRVLGISDQDQF